MITRRSLLQTLAAAAAAPIFVRPTPASAIGADLQPALQRFCDRPAHLRSIHRYNLTSPLHHAGTIYASDARALLAVSAAGRDPTAAPVAMPDFAAVYRRWWRPADRWIPLPARPTVLPAEGHCPRCYYRNFPECPTCDGFGTIVEPEWRDLRVPPRRCPACNGASLTADANCPTCGGRVFGRDLPCLVPFGGRYFAAHYWESLALVPDCQINPGTDPEGPLLFQSASLPVEGFIMPRDL